MLTWNVMGFTTVVDELQDIIRKHEPDLIVLTETKFGNKQHGSYNIKQPFSGLYKIFCTSVSLPANKGKQIQNKDDRISLHERAGAGGVLLAVHNRWQPDAFVRVHAHDNVPYLVSHVLGNSISMPSGVQLNVFGIYMPAKGTIRQQIYNHLKTQANGPHTIMMGDWNADPHRAWPTSADIAYKRFLLTHMQFDVPHDSRPSFLPAQPDQLSSTLDDILLSKNCAATATM